MKADSAMQSIITQIDGVNVKTINQTNNTANFLKGDNIVLSAENGGIKVALANNINLGPTGSVTAGNTIVNQNGVSFTSAGSINEGVRLTSAGLYNGNKRITGVLAGTAPTDAVNVSQLESQTSDITTKGLDFSGNLGGDIHKDLGQKLEIVGTLDASKTASAKNIRTVANGGKLEIQLADDLDVTSVTTGDSLLNNAGLQVGSNVFITNQGLQAGNTNITNNGLTFTGSTVAVTASGINAGSNKITNVIRGSDLSDAVNVEQLNEVKQSAADANKGWGLSAQGEEATATTVKPGATVDLNNTDGNIKVSKTADNNDVSFNLSRDIAVDSVKTGAATLDSGGLTIAGGPKFTKNSVDAGGNKIMNVANGIVDEGSKDAVNGGQLFEVFAIVQTQTAAIAETAGAGLNFNADNDAITINKKAGSDPLSFKGGDNITTTAEGSSIKFDLNGNINVDSVTTGNTMVNNSGVTIKNGPSMTAAGIYAGNAETAPSMTAAGINAAGTKVTNVADGMAPRDAVNFGQLDAVSRGLEPFLKTV